MSGPDVLVRFDTGSLINNWQEIPIHNIFHDKVITTSRIGFILAYSNLLEIKGFVVVVKLSVRKIKY
jgi:hypothetical protein